MNKRWLSVIWLAGCLLLAVPVWAEEYGDVSVRLVVLTPGLSGSHGYQEFRATIVNRSSSRTHRVTLVFPNEFYGARGNIIREMRRTVEVAPQATVAVSLFKPPLDLAGIGAQVAIDGQAQELPLNSFGDTGLPRSGTSLVLASIEAGQRRTLDYAKQYLQTSDGKPRFTAARIELPVSEWSRHWLGYSGYDGVLVTAVEWQGALDNVRQALWRYVECGGTLLVFGGLDVPAQWQASRTTIRYTEKIAATDEQKFSGSPPPLTKSAPTSAEATPTPTPAPLPPDIIREDLQSYDIGFGKLFVMPAQPQPALTEDQWRIVEAAWQATRSFIEPQYYGSTGRSFEELNSSLPIIEKLTTPVRGLFLLMLLFVIVIGPVNLLVLARRRKKLWLLWTVPAISLVTCLTIAGYAIASEGVSGHARTFSLTLLDEQAHRATTLGFAGFYSPLTPSDGLRFSTETELLPVLPYYYLYNERAGTPRTLDWTNEQHLTSGWVSARVPAWFRLRKSETRRERLSVSTNAQGAPVVTNGLGVPIKHLWLPNERRTIFEAQDLAPGAQVELKESPRPVALATMKSLRDLLAGDWLQEGNQFVEKPEEWLAPGTYLAELEAAPFNEPGLQNVRQRTARTLVLGIR